MSSQASAPPLSASSTLRRPLPVLGLVGALTLTACSATEGEEPDPVSQEATVISPDTLVTCEDDGDCGEAGSLRWSLPLEGEYVMHVPESFPGVHHTARIFPVDLVAPEEFDHAGATVRDGVLYFHENERFRAIDLDTMDQLWAAELDPDRAIRVRGLQWVGDRLVVLAEDEREWSGLLYLLTPGRDGPERETVDVGTHTPRTDLLPANDTHVLVPEPGGSRVHHLVDAATGEAEWSVELEGHVHPNALAEDAAFMTVSQGGGAELIQRVDLADGEVTDEFPVPSGLRQSNLHRLTASPDGDLLVGDGGVVDTETGELLWSHDEEAASGSSEIGWSARFHEDAPELVHLRNGERTAVVEARSGEAVETDVPDPREDLFGAYQPWYEEESTQRGSDAYRAPVRAYGPGAEEGPLITLGAGTRYLTTYRTGDGAYAGVYQACAPDGMRAASPGSPLPQRACVAPRLFAVDHGVAGAAPR